MAVSQALLKRESVPGRRFYPSSRVNYKEHLYKKIDPGPLPEPTALANALLFSP